MPDNPNPQGKGLVPVLEHWASACPSDVGEKDARTVLTDYLVSLLVLSAKFRFKPVPGKTYHLYRSGGDWRLSLIAPWEWSRSTAGSYVGSCCLRTDMTWEISPAEDLEKSPGLVDDLAVFASSFAASMDSQDTLEEGLPFYVSRLPFYQRLLATGLAVSLEKSVRLSGLAGRDASRWANELAATTVPLLSGRAGPCLGAD